VPCSVMQCKWAEQKKYGSDVCDVAVCCSVAQCVAVFATKCATQKDYGSDLCDGAVCCRVVQCVAVFATKCATQKNSGSNVCDVAECCNVLQCSAMCCTQCAAQKNSGSDVCDVAVCCSVLQCVALRCNVNVLHKRTLDLTFVMLQYVAVCCIATQCAVQNNCGSDDCECIPVLAPSPPPRPTNSPVALRLRVDIGSKGAWVRQCVAVCLLECVCWSVLQCAVVWVWVHSMQDNARCRVLIAVC